MSCAKPIVGYYGNELGGNGKRRIVFALSAAFSPVRIPLPCGQCIGCKLEKSRQWAMRCLHEARLSSVSTFLTLTYDNKHMPENGSLSRSDPQLFLKRLRFKYGAGIRFYGCGEYGDLTNRPHYHLLLFNFDFPDKKPYFNRLAPEPKHKLYTSKVCSELWTYGDGIIGEVTWESCAYVARYITKKITGKAADDHYMGRLPEFAMMSRRPGIGTKWFEKYGKESYDHDSVIINAKEVKPPKFYDTKYELIDEATMLMLKRSRRRRIDRSDNTPERRAVKEQVAKLNLRSREV